MPFRSVVVMQVADMFVSGLEGDDLLVELLTLLSHDNEDVQEVGNRSFIRMCLNYGDRHGCRC